MKHGRLGSSPRSIVGSWHAEISLSTNQVPDIDDDCKPDTKAQKARDNRLPNSRLHHLHHSHSCTNATGFRLQQIWSMTKYVLRPRQESESSARCTQIAYSMEHGDAYIVNLLLQTKDTLNVSQPYRYVNLPILLRYMPSFYLCTPTNS